MESIVYLYHILRDNAIVRDKGMKEMNITNAVRQVRTAGLSYETKEYEVIENDFDGTHVALAIGLDPDQVFKTLVTTNGKREYFVFVLPVSGELDLKKAAKAAGQRSIEMLPLKELTPLTGYVRGGCSPVGMKKRFPTYIDETAQLFERISVSAGMRGLQLIMAPDALLSFVEARYADLLA